MKENLLTDCKYILEESELKVFDVGTSSRLVNWIWLPIMQFTTGFKDITLPTSIGTTIWLALFLGTFFITTLFDLPAEFMKYGSIGCIVLPVVAMLFASPSSYSTSGITEENVSYLSEIILQRAKAEKSKVELLYACFDTLELRIDSRTKFYRMLIGAYWTYNILLVNLMHRQVDLVIAVWKSIYDASFYLLFCWLLYLSYKRGSDILIRTIRLAFKNATNLTKPVG